MNLIERLGGYDSLKKEYEETLPLIQKGYKSKGMEIIRLLLLEHRRQHNIFEVGDSVLPISNYSDQVHFLADWYIENLDFRYTTNSGSWGIIVKSLMDGAWRHATDEEIKAGKRLEVKSEN